MDRHNRFEQKLRDDNCKTHTLHEVYEVYILSRNFDFQNITQQFLDKLESRGVLSSRDRKGIQLAYNEALLNAHEHGNLELKSEWKEELGDSGTDKFSEIKAIRLQEPNFANREIKIRLELKDNELILSVQDEGAGFTPPPIKPVEGNLYSHGRGIQLIRHFMDSVEYKKDGRLIEIRKRIG